MKSANFSNPSPRFSIKSNMLSDTPSNGFFIPSKALISLPNKRTNDDMTLNKPLNDFFNCSACLADKPILVVEILSFSKNS